VRLTMLNMEDNKIIKLLEDSNEQNKPDESLIQALLEKIDFPIDPDYWNFIENHDGGQLFFDNNEYLGLWTVEEVIQLNPYFEGDPEMDNYFFFGSDGSNTGYAFDKRNGGVVSIDYIEWGEVEPKNIGDSFKSFINELSKK